jgi:glycosyltransferase involved in cell wall biosynthesis
MQDEDQIQFNKIVNDGLSGKYERLHGDIFNDVEQERLRKALKKAAEAVRTGAEGFPNTYIQACKCATPILSLAVNPDNFLSKFKCGLCADGRMTEFEEDFNILLEPETNRRFGQNSRRYAEETHDIKKIIEIYKDLSSAHLEKKPDHDNKKAGDRIVI